MNGRLYDPLTGRFLSADPVVQELDNLQKLNRYSYVLNNPLSLTDPSGFSFLGKIGKFFSQNWKTFAAIGVGILTGGLGAGAALGFQGTFLGALAAAASTTSTLVAAAAGAGFGFGSAFSGTLLAGGSIGDALRAGFVSGIISGATAGAINGAANEWGLHGLKPTDSDFIEKLTEKVAVHGSIGSVATLASGGKLIHGLLSGAFTGFASPFIGAYVGENYQVAAAAVVGGTAAELGGGKFSNGAVTGAFVYLFNETVTKISINGKEALSNPSPEELKKYIESLPDHSITEYVSIGHGGTDQYGSYGLAGNSASGALVMRVGDDLLFTHDNSSFTSTIAPKFADGAYLSLIHCHSDIAASAISQHIGNINVIGYRTRILEVSGKYYSWRFSETLHPAK